MTEEDKPKSEIILAESGPKRADRPNTYHVGNCTGCGMEVYWFKSERYVNCHQCGVWTKKPENGKVMTI